MPRWIGIDWGRRRIGLALSAPGGRYSTPLAVLEVARPGEEWQELERLAGDAEADGFVVGLPLDENGAEGETATEIRRWAAGLRRRLGRPIAFADEAFSSAWADEELREQGVPLKRRRKISDALAAKAMLDAWLAKRSAKDP